MRFAHAIAGTVDFGVFVGKTPLLAERASVPAAPRKQGIPLTGGPDTANIMHGQPDAEQLLKRSNSFVQRYFFCRGTINGRFHGTPSFSCKIQENHAVFNRAVQKGYDIPVSEAALPR